MTGKVIGTTEVSEMMEGTEEAERMTEEAERMTEEAERMTETTWRTQARVQVSSSE